MNIGDKIIWRYKDKKTWKRSEVVTLFPEQLIELKMYEDFGLMETDKKIIVKLTEIEFAIYEPR